MDEVDRLLDSKKSRGKTSKFYKKHEKPAALIASSVSRLTLGRVQIVAASATVGRPLKRELSRVLGYHPSECPQTIQAQISEENESSRAISIPKTLKHFVMSCDVETSGGLLTSAAFLVKELSKGHGMSKRILFVITNNCGIHLNDAIGALKHFGISPEPRLLLDFMNADGTDDLIEAYRGISETSGVGEKSLSMKSSTENSSGYVLITGENSVRGMHLNDLDFVVVVGRPKGPDEYIHVAGRAGRAGKEGKVVNVVSLEQISALASLESMLGINFEPVEQGELHTLL